MIKNEKLEVNISYRNITHYLKLGYNAIIHKYLEVKTEHLPSTSHVKIQAICIICGSENIIMYCKYLDNKKRHGFYGCKSCSRQKAALTCIEKYGVDNYSKTEEYKKRVEETNMEKFGYKTNLLSPEYKESFKSILMNKYGKENWYEIRNGNRSNIKRFVLKDDIKSISNTIIFSESLYDESITNSKYLLYRNEVRRLTVIPSKILYENWDGCDYYDGENISDNFKFEHNDPEYPTIDHKLSIYYGFVNKINPLEISLIENLCITKRSINSSKSALIEESFKSRLIEENFIKPL